MTAANPVPPAITSPRPAVLAIAIGLALAATPATLGADADAPAEPRTHFLTIGGGYNASGNQVSLEKNVIFYRKLLEAEGLAGCPHTVLFADGDDPAADTQLEDPDQAAPEINQLLATLFGSTRGINHQYRDHLLEKIDGPSAVTTIDRWFNETGAALTPSDRTLIYFTGHGGKSDKKDTQNTSIMLWNRAALRVADFVGRLDKIDNQTPVVLLMVQCYSGGYANVIFNEGDESKGLSDANRCGFFATVHDRTAAGCTPDINEANYEDYSTHFFAALHGTTRVGEPVTGADYNGDGAVDFSEAHAYSLITSDSIDISIKTSDRLLRAFSTTESKKGDVELTDPMTATSAYPALLEAASPAERATLEGLSQRLGLDGDDRAARVAQLAKEADEARKKVEKDRKAKYEEWKKVKTALANDLKNKHPELGNAFHPWVHDLIHGGPATEAFVAEIKADPRYAQMERLATEINALDKQESEQERRWVKLRRFEYVAESIALAANLPQVADEKVVGRYKAMVAAEHATLHRPAAAATNAALEPQQ